MQLTPDLTTKVWNPVTGCDQISAGCDRCYAMRLARRLQAYGQDKYQTDGDPRTSGPGFGIAWHPASLAQPMTWKRPRVVFVSSMGDLFHAKVPTDFLRGVFDTMRTASQHTYWVLTKRPARAWRIAAELGWPSNLWLGVSVESADVLHRLEHLRATPAPVRMLCCEPLLGPLPDLDLTGISWVTVAGEAGPGTRPLDADWARDPRDQAQKADVPFYFKQWGGPRARQLGRDLDGVVWDGLPRELTATRTDSTTATA